ncbi:putative membrane protein [Inhella inkyongensis]|uniref:Putative membrane protein n=1 Tax=Inhella inkyongensis TaxID=392593 RepID=A0A840SB33_9BURK|nr:DUF6249 domain-containing protein [Inhella inkyongensis]MBB5205681.1 putative membrane protein [Inhella inkyongensis]
MDTLELRHILPFLIPIVALLIPIVAIIAYYVNKTRHEEAVHETVRRLSAAGQPIPPQLLDGSAFRGEDSASPRNTATTQLRSGVINLAAGLGLMGMFAVMRPGSWLWAIGLVPVCLGLGFLLLWKLEPRTPQ